MTDRCTNYTPDLRTTAPITAAQMDTILRRLQAFCKAPNAQTGENLDVTR